MMAVFLFELASRNGDIQEPFSLVPTATVSSFQVFNTHSWFSNGKNTISIPAIAQHTPSISLIYALIIPLSFLSLRLVLLYSAISRAGRYSGYCSLQYQVKKPAPLAFHCCRMSLDSHVQALYLPCTILRLACCP